MSSPKQPGDDARPSRPAGSGLGGILRRAKLTATRLDAEDASMGVRKCERCDAARPADEDLRVCAYCGHRFMRGGGDEG